MTKQMSVAEFGVRLCETISLPWAWCLIVMPLVRDPMITLLGDTVALVVASFVACLLAGMSIRVAQGGFCQLAADLYAVAKTVQLCGRIAVETVLRGPLKPEQIAELIDLERTQRQAECDCCENFGQDPSEFTIKICGIDPAPCGSTEISLKPVGMICDFRPGEADHPLFFSLSRPITERLKPSAN